VDSKDDYSEEEIEAYYSFVKGGDSEESSED